MVWPKGGLAYYRIRNMTQHESMKGPYIIHDGVGMILVDPNFTLN